MSGSSIAAGETFSALRRYAEAISLTERALALASKNVFVRAMWASLWELSYFGPCRHGPVAIAPERDSG